MNWHLVLDVMAWIWGVLFTINALAAYFVKYDGERTLAKQALKSAIIAALCWAWIIVR